MAYEKILTENSTINSTMSSGCTIQSKRATTSVAESSDTVLKEGELCFVYEGSKPYSANIRMGDGTTALKNLKNIVPEEITVDSTLSSTSTNPVQNKVINNALAGKANSSHTHSYLPLSGGTLTGIVTTKGIKLTSGTDYGTTLPTSPATNQLFFQTVGSNFVLDNVYPVGAVYMSMNSTNPGTLFGGTWEQVQGKFLLGASSSYPSGSSGGEEKHTLTENELPAHKHTIGQEGNSSMLYSKDYFQQGTSDTDQYVSVLQANMTGTYGKGNVSWGGSIETRTCLWSTGNSHNNMPPYLSVYIWYRTA